MTNGTTFDDMLKRGAEQLVAHTADGETLVEQLFARAFSREPNAQERAIAVELIGKPPEVAGVEDLLWIVTMQPEFQLIP